MRSIATSVFVLAVLLLAGTAPLHARTWYVSEAGTGDAPTIPAAMDSAAYGDTVLVGPGTYYSRIHITDGVALVSELGPTETVLTYGPYEVVWFSQDVSGTLEGFTVTGSQWDDPEYGAIVCTEAEEFLIQGNIITGNASCGIVCSDCWWGLGEIANNTIVENGGDAIRIDFSVVHVNSNICVGNSAGIWLGESGFLGECNDSWGNSTTFWDPTGNGNISEDPLFCDSDGGDFTLHCSSPCIDGYGCGLIGPLGMGCGTTSVEQGMRTWSAIKELYR